MQFHRECAFPQQQLTSIHGNGKQTFWIILRFQTGSLKRVLPQSTKLLHDVPLEYVPFFTFYIFPCKPSLFLPGPLRSSKCSPYRQQLFTSVTLIHCCQVGRWSSSQNPLTLLRPQKSLAQRYLTDHGQNCQQVKFVISSPGLGLSEAFRCCIPLPGLKLTTLSYP